jgi:hypothetical protein
MASQPERKCLRIKLIRGDKTEAMEIFPFGKSVSVGSQIGCDIRLSGEDVPDRFELLAFQPPYDRSGDRYHLQFTKEMRGKVSDEKRAELGLKEIKARKAWLRGDGIWSLTLTQKHHGEVLFGQYTVVFDFVKPRTPKFQPRVTSSPRRRVRLTAHFLVATVIVALFFVYRFYLK